MNAACVKPRAATRITSRAILSAAFLTVLMGLCLPVAHAVKPGKSPIQIERPEELLTETDTFLSSPARTSIGKTLRCWQYGRLLYEGSGFNQLSPTDKTAVTIGRQKGDGLSIINLQDGLCILSDN